MFKLRMRLGSGMRSKIVRGGGHLLGFSRWAGRLTWGLSFGKLRALAGMSAAALVILLAAMIFPALPEAAQAVEGETESGVATLANSTAGVSVPASIDFADVMPTMTGATTQATANVNVTTSNSASYKLYIYAADGDNRLRPKNPSLANISVINAIAGDVGLSSLESNTWGYTLGTSAAGSDATYRAVPTDASAPIQTKDTSATNAADDTYILTLAAKVDTTIASGAYSNTLTFAVVAEPGGIPITYDANGGYYNDDSSQTTQLVEYTIGQGTVTKIAKTSNVSDTGVQDAGYGDNVEETQTVTIPGAESLQVTVSYQTEGTSYDWLAIYDDSVTPSQSNYADSVTGKLGGSTKVDNAVFTIPGDTAQFYFRSDGSNSDYYGYYAVVEGVGATITPSAEVLTPTRPGYVFLGWYKDSAGTPGEEFVIDASLQAGTAYAKWGINYLDDVTYMQDLTATQCANSYDGATATLIDRRDNNSYSIAKINGACWMTSNLRLSGGRTLTPSDSDVDSNWTFPNNSLIAGNSYTEARFILSDDPRYATEYGGYYNYCAASAGSVCSQTQANATQSICPAGWTLPTGGSNSQQSDITSYVDAFSPVLSGYYSIGSLNNTGSRGYWWSATAYNSYKQYHLRYNGGSLYTDDYNKFFGYSVRCIRSS